MNIPKRPLLYCCLLIGLGGMFSSCAQHAIPTTPGGASHSPKYVLFRIASTDHQFTDAAECARQAALYYNNTGNTGAPPQPQPGIYRWKGANDTEVRFVVVSPTAAQPILADHIIDYRELDKFSDINFAFNDLASRNRWTKKQPPTPDPTALLVNGHLTQRAILEIPPTATGGVKALRPPVASRLYGVIINPPYP